MAGSNEERGTMSNKTLIEWNADVGTRILTIHPDGSFDIDKDAPPLFVIGELAKAFIRQQDRIKRLEEALDLVRPHCDSVHHSKKHQHQYGEPCPVVALIENAKEAKL